MTTEETNTVEKEELQEDASQEEKKKKRGGKKAKVSKMEARIAELEDELGESKDKYIRLYAEFDNYKKRTIKERLDLMSTANRDTIAALLPVLDDFDRAKNSADDEDTVETFPEGVTLVYNKLNNLLKSKGLEAMESTGMVFDSELHDAISEIPAPNEEMKGKIIDTIEKGYTLKDKIIRHAKVVVGK